MEREINVDVLNALAHIIDNFHNFNNDIIDVLNKEYSKDVTSSLDLGMDIIELIKGKKIIGHKRLKDFCKKYESTIAEINKYSWIVNFIRCYEFNKEKKQLELNENVEYFYQYLYSNKCEIEKVFALLNRVTSLEISKLSLNPNLDLDYLDDNIFTIEKVLNCNFDFTYFDNIEIVPNYEKSIVKYKSSKSNYVLKIESSIIGYSKKILLVDSLTFDPDKLPQDISVETLFDSIIKKGEEKSAVCEEVRNAINLSIGVDELKEQYEDMTKIVNNIGNYTDRKGVYESLITLRDSINLLQLKSNKYNENVVKNNPEVTGESLTKEKKQYLKRKYWSQFDLD